MLRIHSDAARLLAVAAFSMGYNYQRTEKMKTNNDSENDAQQRDKNPLPVTHPAPETVEVPTVNPPAPAGMQNEAPTDPKQEYCCCYRSNTKQPFLFQQVESKEFSGFEKRTILFGWFGLAIGFLSLLAAYIAGFLVYHQWLEMNTQSGYMNRAAIQARKDSADSSATTSKQLAIAQQEATAAQDSVREVERQTRLDERPYLKIEFLGGAAEGSDKFPKYRWKTGTVGEPLQVPLRITNVGKTAALKINGYMLVQVVPIGNEPSIPGKGEHPLSAVNGVETSVIYQGGWAEVSISRKQLTADGKAEDAVLTQPEEEGLNRPSAYLAIWGKVKYSDIFGKSHWTKYCGALSPWGSYSQSAKCAAYGVMDGN